MPRELQYKKRITVRISDEVLSELEKRAAQAGLKPAILARQLLVSALNIPKS